MAKKKTNGKNGRNGNGRARKTSKIDSRLPPPKTLTKNGLRCGRPPKNIDEGKVAQFAADGYTDRMISDELGVDHHTITSRFSPTLAKNRASMRGDLLRKQLAVAKEGNPTMLIWMGKQLLGQSDQSNITATVVAIGVHVGDGANADRI